MSLVWEFIYNNERLYECVGINGQEAENKCKILLLNPHTNTHTHLAYVIPLTFPIRIYFFSYIENKIFLSLFHSCSFSTCTCLTLLQVAVYTAAFTHNRSRSFVCNNIIVNDIVICLFLLLLLLSCYLLSNLLTNNTKNKISIPRNRKTFGGKQHLQACDVQEETRIKKDEQTK